MPRAHRLRETQRHRRTARPGGQNIRNITEEIAAKFGIDNPQIEIQDIKNPALDAKATVDKMVELCRQGPKHSMIKKADVKDEKFQDFKTFKILHI